MKKLLYIASFCVLLTSCKEEAESPCFTSFGENTTEIRLLEPFTELYLNSDIKIDIIPSEEEKAEIWFGSNLLEYIRTDVEDGRLTIEDNTTCKWFRDLGKKPSIKLYTSQLSYVYNEGTGDIFFTDTLHGTHFFYEQRNAAGTIDILFSGESAKVSLHTGYTTFSIAGTVNNSELYGNAVGPLDARNLISPYCALNNSSISDMYAYSSGYLFAHVGSQGDVYYTGNPTTLEISKDGTGFVLPF